MSLPDFYGPEVEAHQIPPHAEAAIGPVALEHRAKILNEILPRIASALRVYDCAVRVCFYDPEANNNARRELSEAIRDLDRVDLLMLQWAFVQGEG